MYITLITNEGKDFIQVMASSTIQLDVVHLLIHGRTVSGTNSVRKQNFTTATDHAAGLGLRTLTLVSAHFRASVLNCGLSAARTALAQIEEKRM